MVAIEIDGVCKRFVLQHDRPRSFMDVFLKATRPKARAPREAFWALRDVSYRLEEGEALGVIGENGSGKSTLLKLIARILEPTAGCIRTHAPVSALLELGAGFHPDLTGRENIYLNGSILGLRRAEIGRRFDEIVDFAELERFIDVPVRHYSSGMYVRLGFAVATCLNPRILLIDEILAVGDEAFQTKSKERIGKLREAGATTVFVSHDIDAVAGLCTQAIWLDQGVVRASGITAQVIDAYRAKISSDEEERLAQAQEATERGLAAVAVPAPGAGKAGNGNGAGDPAAAQVQLNGKPLELEPLNEGWVPEQRRWGSREVEITGVRFLDGQGRPRHLFETGQPFTARFLYRAHRRIERPVFGLALHREDGTVLAGPNTLTSQFAIEAVEGLGSVDYHVDMLPLMEGRYDLSVSVYDETLTHAYDHQYRFYPFRVQSRSVRQVLGYMYIPCNWSASADQPALPAGETIEEAK